MKKTQIVLFCLLLYSCCSTKQIISPAIQFKLYDVSTKMPIDNVILLTNDAIDSVNVWVQYPKKSNSKGLLDFKAKELELKGNIRNFMPVVNTEFQFKKEGYETTKIKLFNYFKIDENSNVKKTYVSDSIFLKKQ